MIKAARDRARRCARLHQSDFRYSTKSCTSSGQPERKILKREPTALTTGAAGSLCLRKVGPYADIGRGVTALKRCNPDPCSQLGGEQRLCYSDRVFDASTMLQLSRSVAVISLMLPLQGLLEAGTSEHHATRETGASENEDANIV